MLLSGTRQTAPIQIQYTHRTLHYRTDSLGSDRIQCGWMTRAGGRMDRDSFRGQPMCVCVCVVVLGRPSVLRPPTIVCSLVLLASPGCNAANAYASVHQLTAGRCRSSLLFCCCSSGCTAPAPAHDEGRTPIFSPRPSERNGQR
jgi:hypothetical protein